MHKQLFVLIATIDERLLHLGNILQAYDEKISYIISHQITQEVSDEVKQFRELLHGREDVVYSALNGKGVAKNRNNTLRFIEPSAICLILDDDVSLCQDAFNTVLNAFEENPSAEFISFKILDMQGDDYKRYPFEKHQHSRSTLTSIGTTEMAFRSDMVLKHNIRFDERFGPGSDQYSVGEDSVFAMDIYKMKIRMLFVPKAIVKHPKGSTGALLKDEIIFGRGAVFARIFGISAFLLDIYFALRHRKNYRSRYSLFQYIHLLTSGSFDYLYRRP